MTSIGSPYKAIAMKRSSIPLILLLLSLLGSAGSVWAQGYWRELPPDERRQMRQQMREHWRELPPEDRQRWREQRQERRESFQQMAPDDRSRLRDELRSRRESPDGGSQRHGPQNSLGGNRY